MRLIEIAIGTVLRIPDAWTKFVYRGRLYVADSHGHFTVREWLSPYGPSEH